MFILISCTVMQEQWNSKVIKGCCVHRLHVQMYAKDETF